MGALKGFHDDFVTVLALLENKIKRKVAKEPWSVYLVAGAPKTALDPNAPRPSAYRVTNNRWANLGSTTENTLYPPRA
jgi:hypothetical protein